MVMSTGLRVMLLSMFANGTLRIQGIVLNDFLWSALASSVHKSSLSKDPKEYVTGLIK